MQKVGKFLIGLIFVLAFLVAGCSKTPPANSNLAGRAEIDFVNKDHRMERINFAGGVLRTAPEVARDNIVLTLPKGSQGIFYGKRKINNIEWAKVTTREGVTGWYGLQKDPREPERAQLAFDLTNKNYQVSYPKVSGISEEAATRINDAIANYLSVFNYVTGAVGNPLQCQITYNQKNLLSIMFFAPSVRNRYYGVTDINNTGYWQRIRKYCYMTDFYSALQPDKLYVAISDLQYGMVFDLTSGRRLRYNEFLAQNTEDEVKARVAEFGQDAYLAPDNFYLEQGQKVAAFVEHSGTAPGRSILNLGDLARK